MKKPSLEKKPLTDFAFSMRDGPISESKKQCLSIRGKWKPRKQKENEAPPRTISPMTQPYLEPFSVLECTRPGANDHRKYKSLMTSGDVVYRMSHL